MLTLSGYRSSGTSLVATADSMKSTTLSSSISRSGAAAASSYSFSRTGGTHTVRKLIPWFAAALLFVLLLSTLWGFSQANGSEVSPAAPNERSITVTTGDTLWSIAAAYNIADDTREGVFRLQKRNGLSSTTITPGDQLIIPSAS